jgi:multiple sugar transport system permease protein
MQLPRVLRSRSMAQREERIFYLFVSLWLIGLVLFNGGPILASFGLSLTNWSGASFSELRWIGLENYTNLLNDNTFWLALRNTFVYATGRVLFGTLLALVLAILLNQRVRGLALFRTIFYMPSVAAGVALSLSFIWLFNPAVGIINYGLSIIGIKGPGWLGTQMWAMPALILVSLWSVGPNMIILLAGLQGIPESLYEAARIDGANWWKQIRHVTLPMLSPALFFVMVISVVQSFQIFTEVQTMTQGGPGNATMVYVYYLYQNAFTFSKMGYASALAWILFMIVMSLVALQFWIAKRWVYYET